MTNTFVVEGPFSIGRDHVLIRQLPMISGPIEDGSKGLQANGAGQSPFCFLFFVKEFPVSPNAMDSDFLFSIQVDIIQCRLCIFSLAFFMTGQKVHDESPSRAAGVYRHLKNGIIRLKFFTTPAFIIVLHHPLAGRWQMFAF
jgi:hypothetical protein